ARLAAAALVESDEKLLRVGVVLLEPGAKRLRSREVDRLHHLHRLHRRPENSAGRAPGKPPRLMATLVASKSTCRTPPSRSASPASIWRRRRSARCTDPARPAWTASRWAGAGCTSASA